MFSKVVRIASEEVVLNLIRTKCLPVLLYGVEACMRQALSGIYCYSLTYEATSHWIGNCCQRLHDFFSLLASQSSSTQDFTMKGVHVMGGREWVWGSKNPEG